MQPRSTKIMQAIEAVTSYPEETISTMGIRKLFPKWDKIGVQNRIVSLRAKGYLIPIDSQLQNGYRVYKIMHRKAPAVKKPDVSMAELGTAVHTLISYLRGA